MSRTTSLDSEILAWYESQTEELLRDLQDRFDAQTPRQAWIAFFNDCAYPAQKNHGDSLAAPAEAGQGVCTHLVASRTSSNRGQWLQIAAALDKHLQRDLFNHALSVGRIEAARTAQGAPRSGEGDGGEALYFAINFGGCVEPDVASTPHGNHGGNFSGRVL